MNFPRFDPVAGEYGKAGILLVFACDIDRDIPAVLPSVARPSVVEMMDHLRLVQGQILHPVFAEHVPHQLPPVAFELLPRVEEVRVVGHVEHGAEPDTPRIVLGLVVPGFTDEHRHAPIDRLGQLGIATGAEGRASPGVGVQ